MANIVYKQRFVSQLKEKRKEENNTANRMKWGHINSKIIGWAGLQNQRKKKKKNILK